MSYKFTLLVGGIAVCVGGVLWAMYGFEVMGNCRNFEQGSLSTRKTSISIDIAILQKDQERGLSGCKKMPEKTGMYFPFIPASMPAFWMKDMKMPIDIVWLVNGKVLSVTASVPPPTGAFNEELIRYYPPRAVDGVLEVGSGKAAEYGLFSGAEVTLKQ